MFKFEVSIFGMLSHKICILFFLFFSCKYVYKMKIHFSFFLVYSYVQRSVRRSGRVKKFILNQKNSKTEPWCSQYRFKTLPQISPSLSPPPYTFSILLPVPPVFPPYWPHTADCQQVGQHHPLSMRSQLLPQNCSQSISVLKLITNEASDPALHLPQCSCSQASLLEHQMTSFAYSRGCSSEFDIR